ncbi:uncharacterized protein BDW43DRAFT_299947 [Aspergillus alliaceus]|uniref:uncharacterized protein n=1 Tax=Petromyces alliaceus TaxID=209559 RepID=UPI0012A636D6|nr:uncharacterized protein BDW43DRAFT_299947 [Aspergillus alliaceus]KAB8234020.1 hypothetical protein BDW43DRAFT_299947 [Aspergillus alliaceus]
MIRCCNELNIGYAADGYARSMPGRVAVVFVTFMVVIVSSDSPLQETFSQDRLVHHTLGVKKQRSTLPDFQGSTTAAVRLTTDNDPIGTLDSTISHCLEDSSPVYIEISSSISQTPCEPPKPPIVNKPLPQQPDHINTVADAIGPSPDVLVSSIDKLGYAVFVQPDSKPLVPEGHPQFAGTFWSSANYQSLDSHLAMKYITSPYGETIQGISLNDIVRALIASNIPHNGTTSRALPLALGLRTEALTVVPTFEGIEDILKPNDTLFAKTGDSWFNANTIQLPNGTNFHMQMIYASIEWGLPATLIYQVGRPDGRVITMIGDGSFRMPRRNLGYTVENYTVFASSLCNRSAISALNPPMVSMQIKSKAEHLIALDRAEREPTKLAIL